MHAWVALLQEDELGSLFATFHWMIEQLDLNMEWEARQAQLHPACCA